MKVKDLLKALEGANPDDDITFKLDEGCCGDWFDLECYEMSQSSFNTWGLFSLRFKCLPGYESCISSGQMKRLAENIEHERNKRK